MKIVINYDFFKAINDVNHPLTPLKVIKNEPKYPIVTAILAVGNYAAGSSFTYTLERILFWYSIYLINDFVFMARYQHNFGVDKYVLEASRNLQKLPDLLDAINVKTNYNMLLKSELYERRFKLESNDSDFCPIKEEKYIYVPSFGFDGREKETSILQEHNIGSREYHLSVEEPEKRYRRVLINNNA